MTTYSVYAVIPHYDYRDGISGISFAHTGRRYFSKELACKIADRLSSQAGYDDHDFRVVRDGDRSFEPVRIARPINYDDIPF